MKLHVYTIYDVASGIYMRPFFQQTDGQATRSFSDIALDADHEIGKHPEDYTLFRIGQYNDNTGKLEGEIPEKIITALQCVHAAQHVDKDQLKLFKGQANG